MQNRLHALLAVAVASLLAGLVPASDAEAQGVPVEASSVVPTATILFDTSGGMEFLPVQPTGPPVCACVNPPDEFDCPPTGHEWPVVLNGETPVELTPTFAASGTPYTFHADFYASNRTRFHYALEAMGGTIENFFCAWDYRDDQPARVDQLRPDRPQGIPHARPCSFDPDNPPQSGETPEQYLQRSCGTNIRQIPNGIVPSNAALVYFGLASYDSFRERDQDASGMFSYACDPALVQGRDFPSPSNPEADCLGIRAPSDGSGSTVPGGLVLPDLASGTQLPETAGDLVRNRLRTIVPYWSTPLSPAFHDLWYMLTYEDAIVDDPQAECRPHNVIFVGDGIPTFEVCWEAYESGMDPVPPGCEEYWYTSLMENLERLHLESRQPPGDLSDYDLPVRIFPIGFGLTGEELEASRLGDLSRFTGTGDDRIIDVPEDPSIPIPADDPNLWLAENVAQFQSDLGRALAAILSAHVVSRSVPFTSTATRGFTFENQSANERIVMSRFRGVTSIDPFSSFWSGDVERFDWICAPDNDGVYTIQERMDGEGIPERSWSYGESLNDQIGFGVPGTLGSAELRAERRVYTNLAMNSCAVGDMRDASVRHNTPFTQTVGVTADTLTASTGEFGNTLTQAEVAAACLSHQAFTFTTFYLGQQLEHCLDLLRSAYPTSMLTDIGENAAAPDAICMGHFDENRSDSSLLTGNPAFAFFGISNDDIDGGGAPTNASGSAAARRVIEWVRGANLQELVALTPSHAPPFPQDPDNFEYEVRDRASAMGSVLFSSPTVLGPPVFGLPFSGYEEFLDQPLNPNEVPTDPDDEVPTLRDRTATLFVSSDTGTLHAFDAASGEEIWAFVPRIAYHRMNRLPRMRVPLMEGSPVVRDMRVFRGLRPDGDNRPADLWRTILVSGVRDGGRGYFAIDVTQPTRPVFLWQLDSENDAQLGLTYGQPALATVALDAETCSRLTEATPNAEDANVQLDIGYSREETACQRGVAILPGGVHPEGLEYGGGSNIGKVLYVVDILTGRVIRRFNGLIDSLEPEQTLRERCDQQSGYCVPRTLGAQGLDPCHEDAGPQCDEGYACAGWGYEDVVDETMTCAAGLDLCVPNEARSCLSSPECAAAHSPDWLCYGATTEDVPDPDQGCAFSHITPVPFTMHSRCYPLAADPGPESPCHSAEGPQCGDGLVCVNGSGYTDPDPVNACDQDANLCYPVDTPPGNQCTVSFPACPSGQTCMGAFEGQDPGVNCDTSVPTDPSWIDGACSAARFQAGGGLPPVGDCVHGTFCAIQSQATGLSYFGTWVKYPIAGRDYCSCIVEGPEPLGYQPCSTDDQCGAQVNMPGACEVTSGESCSNDEDCPNPQPEPIEGECRPPPTNPECVVAEDCTMEVDVPGICSPDTPEPCTAEGLCLTQEPVMGSCIAEGSRTCDTNYDCLPESQAAIPAPISGSVAAFDTFAGNLATRAFVGDSEGRMLRVDMSTDDPDEWRLEIFFDPARAADYPGIETLSSEEQATLSTGRPILYRPVIAYLDNLSDAVVIYGQGDVDSLSRMAIGEVGLDNLIFSLVERPRFDVVGGLESSSAQVNWILRLGADRGEGQPDRAEILTVQPRIFNRVVYFATFMENEDPCLMGDPRLYGVHYTGPRYIPESPDGLDRYVRLVEPIDTAAPADRQHSIVGMLDAPEGEKAFFYEAEDEEGALVQTRSVINSIDIVQLPSCFDPGGEGFGSEEGAAQAAAAQTGDFSLFVSASRAGDPDSASAADRQARQVQGSLSLARPVQPALPTSWGTIVPW